MFYRPHGHTLELVASLVSEMEGQESCRQRERRRRRRTEASLEATTAIPRAAMDAAKDAFADGSTALLAGHEHTLRLVEMRLKAMNEQLERCYSVLPLSARAAEDPGPGHEPPSPVPFGGDDWNTDDDWADETTGGLALDSLPLHMPSDAHGASGVSRGAYGIHGRRPAVSTPPWSANPASLSSAWWEEVSRERADSLDDDATVGAAAVAAAVAVMAMDDLEATAGADFGEPESVSWRARLAVRNEPMSVGRASLRASGTSNLSEGRPTPSAPLPGWEPSQPPLEVNADFLESSGPFATDAAALRQQTNPWSFVQSLGDALGLGVMSSPPARTAVTSLPSHRSASIAHHRAAVAGSLHASIAKHPIFAALSPGLRRLAADACMREVRVRPGTVVAAQGAECDAFAVVSSGLFDGYIAEAGPMPVRLYKRALPPRTLRGPHTARPACVPSFSGRPGRPSLTCMRRPPGVR